MRLLIIDDHPVVVIGCRAIFAGLCDVEIVDVRDGMTGVEAFATMKPDLALVDINLPGASGFEVIERIVERAPEARLIAFSMNADPAIAAKSIDFGARAFLTKSDPPEQFLEAVDSLMKGKSYLTPAMARDVAFLRARGSDALTPRETDIMRGLASGRTLTEIAGSLDIAYKTAAANAAQLRQKLGARSTQDLIRMAVEKMRG